MEVLRKTKRKPLACVQCSKRKVRCNKEVPCHNCIERGHGFECRREVVIVRGKVANETKTSSKATRNSSKAAFKSGGNGKNSELSNKIWLFDEADVDNIRSCMERLTFGFIKVARLFKGQNRPGTDWPEFTNSFESVMSSMNHSNSHSLCAFASYYINFIHNAVVPKLFMAEHEVFWSQNVERDRACLVYSNPSKLQSLLPRDYYYWMAMYYATLCNGVYFGSTELMDELDFSPLELQSLGPHFFNAAYDCLFRAQFMDVPDIRAILVYCLMSTCFHAYGNVELSQSLLVQCVRIARKLKLHTVTEVDEVDFATETKKRLWYTLCLIDWLDQMDREKFEIENSEVPMPALITDEILTSPERILLENIPQSLAGQNYSSAYYQRVMVEMSRIKLVLLSNNPSEIVQGWYKMKKLREDTSKLYAGTVIASTDDLLSKDLARFLLFSSLTEEFLDLGRKVLAIVGRAVWAETYRSTYIRAAMENVESATSVVPSYYRRHWIICQHHIYSALTILLDMIMFPDDDAEMNRRILEKIEGIFPIFQELEETHLPARLGLAVLPRLCKLVRFVRVDKQEGNIFEITSLRGFFKDLQERRDPEVRAVPDIESRQYFRLSKKKDNPGPITIFTGQNGLVYDFQGVNEVDKLLRDSSWSELLMNMFELSRS